MVEVLIRPQVTRTINSADARAAAQAVLDAEAASVETSLTLVLTDNTEIRALNRQFRGVDTPTDVLAFGQEPTDQPFVTAPDEPPYLGDIILSLSRAQEQAAEHGHSVEAELRLLIVHGVLHLLGYDHITPEQEIKMWARQDAILSTLGACGHA